MFPDRPTIHFDAWIETEWGEFTGIYINGHEGSTTLEEVVAAREWSMDNPPDHPMDYGNIETVHIDGRTGWAWMEMWRENGLHEVRYHVAIPYDTVTYGDCNPVARDTAHQLASGAWKTRPGISLSGAPCAPPELP